MTPLRVASLVEGRLAGSSISARPGPFSFRRGGAIAIAMTFIIVGIITPALSTALATTLACALLLVVGLPHGALDIATLRRAGPTAQLPVVGAYLGAAAVMFAIWWASPLTGLAVFYTVSMVHFGDDWGNDRDPLFGRANALALLSAPAVLHGKHLAGLFVVLTRDPRSAVLVDLLMLVAPVATCFALVGLATMASRQRSVEGLCALLAMFILPPVIGFALFFCLFHSPRHFREGWATLGPKADPGTSVRVAAMTLAGFGIAAVIYAVIARPNLSAGVFATSILTLSVLTVPHMLLQGIVAVGNRPAGSRQRGSLAA